MKIDIIIHKYTMIGVKKYFQNNSYYISSNLRELRQVKCNLFELDGNYL